jgi:hypothetical protein
MSRGAIDRLIRYLHLLWRAESLIVSFRIQRASTRGALLAVAGLAMLFGLAMLNVAGFFALQPIVGAVAAALLVAAADVLIAGVVAVAAKGIRPDPDLVSALEAREAAIEELSAELGAMQAEFRATREEFASIKSIVTSFIHRPFESPFLGLLLPLIRSFMKSRRQASGSRT